jgi:hypothetical protein
MQLRSHRVFGFAVVLLLATTSLHAQTEDVHNIRKVRRVVANGILYESAPLWESVGFQP